MKKYFAVILMVVFSLSGLPLAYGAADLGAGKVTYDQSCTICHGATGKGDGKAAVMMKLKIRDFTDKSVMAKIPDKDLTNIIVKGGKALNKNPKMPAYGTSLSKDEINNVVAYIRSLSK